MKSRLPQEYTPKGSTNMLKQMQKMQEDMASLEEEMSDKEYTATAGGGVVEATVSGDRTLMSLSIKPEIVDPEDIEMLTDLIVAAVREAQNTASNDYSDQVAQITGGIDVPGLF